MGYPNTYEDTRCKYTNRSDPGLNKVIVQVLDVTGSA